MVIDGIAGALIWTSLRVNPRSSVLGELLHFSELLTLKIREKFPGAFQSREGKGTIMK